MGRTDRAVDVRSRSADPAHHVVMVVTDAHLERAGLPAGSIRRTSPTSPSSAHCVVDGLLGDSPEPELDGGSQGVDIGMRVRGHLVEQSQARR